VVSEEAGVIRGFLAIELPADLRAGLAAIQQDLKRHIERTVDQVRIGWVSPVSMHLTLRFLGDMPEESIESLRTGIEQVASTPQALSLPFERIGVFPSRSQPRVLWAGPSESWQQGPEAERLRAFHRAIEDCCQTRGFTSEERPFNPHLTLARIKQGERLVGRVLVSSDMVDRPVPVGVLPIEAIALMRSQLHPGGSIYTKLWEVRMGTT
jgi:2'-5' RNA ligase